MVAFAVDIHICEQCRILYQIDENKLALAGLHQGSQSKKDKTTETLKLISTSYSEIQCFQSSLLTTFGVLPTLAKSYSPTKGRSALYHPAAGLEMSTATNIMSLVGT